MEEASDVKTWFQPGPRPAWDVFKTGGLLILGRVFSNF